MEFRKDDLKEIIQAILFVAGEGIEIEYLAEKLEAKPADIKKAIDLLKSEKNQNSGIQIIEYKNKIQLSSNPKFAEAISCVLNPIREKALTKAALETVAIIAYKQPITRLEIEDIRRVSCDYAINVLEEHRMIEVVGRKDAVGKPLLYGTTDEFLKRFGLTELDALPNYDELMERIAVIRQEETQKSDSLYRDYELKDLSAENMEQNHIKDSTDALNNDEVVINNDENVEINDSLKKYEKNNQCESQILKKELSDIEIENLKQLKENFETLLDNNELNNAEEVKQDQSVFA